MRIGPANSWLGTSRPRRSILLGVKRLPFGGRECPFAGQDPSPALDIMVNGWLPYQTLGCRIRGRRPFTSPAEPSASGISCRMPRLWCRCGRKKPGSRSSFTPRTSSSKATFCTGGTPPTAGVFGPGSRMSFVASLLTVDYIRSTGDLAILEELIPYLTAKELAHGEDEVFLRPEPSGESSDLYGHCCRAIDRSLVTGRHGLPSSVPDGTDGMNRVGREGRGESVWMGFFLVMVLEGFESLCAGRGDQARANRYADHRQKLVGALNDTGWDGRGTRRGYYDDGSPLGSVQNQECRIDALAQAWAVLSEVAPPDRADLALAALEGEPGPSRTPASSNSWRPRLSIRPGIPATSRVMWRASGRTAASTPTPPAGWSGPWPRPGGGTRRPTSWIS